MCLQIEKDENGVEKFCGAYECTENGWEIGFEVCVCPKKEKMEKMVQEAKRQNPELKICCPTTYHAELGEIDKRTLTCQFPDKSQTCNHEFMKEQSSEYQLGTNDFCVGPSWPIQNSFWNEGLKMTKYGCQRPCNGKTPCLR